MLLARVYKSMFSTRSIQDRACIALTNCESLTTLRMSEIRNSHMPNIKTFPESDSRVISSPRPRSITVNS